MNLNDHPTIEQLRELIRQADDRAGHHLLWVSKTGEIELSRMPAGSTPARFQADHPEMELRHELFLAGNEYVGPQAAADDEYVTQLFDSLLRSTTRNLNGKGETPVVIALDSVFDPEGE
jgi:hypothetical protein